MQKNYLKYRLAAALWVFLTYMIAVPALRADASEMVVMKVTLNTEEAGDYFFLMEEGGAVLFRTDDLLKMGFNALPEELVLHQAGDDYMSLSSFVPPVTYEIDRNESVLHLSVPPQHLKKTAMDLALATSYEVSRIRSNTAFLNYSLTNQFDEDFKTSSFITSLEAGLNIDGWAGFSSFSYSYTPVQERFVRLLTHVTRDDETKLRRYVFGDYFAASGNLGGSGNFGGVSVFRNYGITPNMILSPGLNITGELDTPSDVELYINDLLVRREKLPAGPFELANVPGANGSGTSALVITDAFGRKQRLESLYYVSSQLLRPGIRNYNLSLGFKRENLGLESFEYGGLVFSGFARQGLLSWLTAGVRAEAAEDLANAGGSADFLLWKLGEVRLSAAASYDAGEDGYSAQANYFFGGRHFNFSLSGTGATRRYATISQGAEVDKARFVGSASVGFNQHRFGSLTLTLSRTDMYAGIDADRVSLFYNRRLFRNVSFLLGATRFETDTVTDEVFAGLNFLIGTDKSGNLNYSVSGGRSVESASFYKNPPLGPGIGYGFTATRNEDFIGDRDFSGSASFDVRRPYAIFSADYLRVVEQNSLSLGLSGSLAYVGGSVYPSRPINDSFALVRVADLKGVKVKYSNQEIGKTNSHGEAIVPDLISYNNNYLSIEDKDVPVNYEITRIAKTVTTSVRSGGVVDFKVKKLQGFVGTAYFVEKGVRTPAEYAGLELGLPDEKVEAIVGSGGDVYLENIPSGTFPARLFDGRRDCKFDIVIPESDDIMVNIGEVTCEMD